MVLMHEREQPANAGPEVQKVWELALATLRFAVEVDPARTSKKLEREVTARSNRVGISTEGHRYGEL
jgi:hypothetical protein